LRRLYDAKAQGTNFDIAIVCKPLLYILPLVVICIQLSKAHAAYQQRFYALVV
jgi:hypothetical protein